MWSGCGGSCPPRASGLHPLLDAFAEEVRWGCAGMESNAEAIWDGAQISLQAVPVSPPRLTQRGLDVVVPAFLYATHLSSITAACLQGTPERRGSAFTGKVCSLGTEVTAIPGSECLAGIPQGAVVLEHGVQTQKINDTDWAAEATAGFVCELFTLVWRQDRRFNPESEPGRSLQVSGGHAHTGD